MDVGFGWCRHVGHPGVDRLSSGVSIRSCSRVNPPRNSQEFNACVLPPAVLFQAAKQGA